MGWKLRFSNGSAIARISPPKRDEKSDRGEIARVIEIDREEGME